MTGADLTTLLEKLAASGVDFVLVGGLAAVAQGAPVTTFDVDIVPRRTPENVDRLLAFLAEIGARYRGRPAAYRRPQGELRRFACELHRGVGELHLQTAVPRPDRLDLPGVHRGAVQVGADGRVYLLRRGGQPAWDLPHIQGVGHE